MNAPYQKVLLSELEGTYMNKKELIVLEAYEEYLSNLSRGLCKASSLNALSYLHPITLARVVKFIQEKEKSTES